MKSFFQTILAILPLLSLLAVFSGQSVDARMNARRAHSDIVKRLDTGEMEMELEKRTTPTRFLAKAPYWVAYTLTDYSSVCILCSGGNRTDV